MLSIHLISSEQISGINLRFNIVQTAVIAVSNNRLAVSLELVELVFYNAAEEGAAVLQRGFIDNNLRSLGLNALHNSLNAALAEVVGIGFHRQTDLILKIYNKIC